MYKPTSVTELLYYRFIKYTALRPLIETSFLPLARNTTVVNVYIDLYQWYRALYRADYLQDPINIVSCTINHAIHYRNLFRKLNKYANVFLVYSPSSNAHCTKFCPSWNCANINNAQDNKEVSTAIRQGISLLQTVVPYLPDIYLKLGTFEVPVMIGDMISKFMARGMNVPNLVVSSSQYAFQIPPYIPNTILLYSKQYRSEDRSYTVDLNQAVWYFIKETRDLKQQIPMIDPRFITMVMALLGIPKKSLPSLFTYSQILDMVKHLVNDFILPTPEHITELALNTKSNYTITGDEIMRRYHCIDLSYQMELYNTMPESKETSYLSQLQDMDSLLKINDTYFQSNPISLDKL